MQKKPQPVNELYLNLIREIWAHGRGKKGRNGATLELQDISLKTSLAHWGFPITTIRHISFAQSLGEYISFVQGTTDNNIFVGNGCNFWTANLNEEKWVEIRQDSEDLGQIYGYQWRNGFNTDQWYHLNKGIITEPMSRRHIMTSYNPKAKACLPPCHLLYQFLVEDDKLNMIVTMRSLDVVIGLPYDWVLFGLMLESICKYVDRKPGTLTINVGSAHIYGTHFDVVQEILRAGEPLESRPFVSIIGGSNVMIPRIEEYMLYDYPKELPKYSLEMVV